MGNLTTDTHPKCKDIDVSERSCTPRYITSLSEKVTCAIASVGPINTFVYFRYKTYRQNSRRMEIDT